MYTAGEHSDWLHIDNATLTIPGEGSHTVQVRIYVPAGTAAGYYDLSVEGQDVNGTQKTIVIDVQVSGTTIGEEEQTGFEWIYLGTVIIIAIIIILVLILIRKK